MNDFILIIILLPIIFMLHEFEEIICFKPWIEKNQSWLITKYPLFSKLVAHLNEMSVPTFAMLVLEEFILVSIVTITALTLHWYNIWVAIFTAFAFHILIHIIQWIIIRKYIPVIITSLLALPYIFWGLNTILKEIPINCIILYWICGVFVMCINLGEFYQFNLSSCIRQQNSLTAQFVSFSLSNLANIFYPPQFLQ